MRRPLCDAPLPRVQPKTEKNQGRTVVARSQASTSEHSWTTPPARGEIVRVLRNILATHGHYPEDLILQAHPASRRCTCNTFKALTTHIRRSDEQRLHVVAKDVPSMRTFMHPFSPLVERGRVDLKKERKVKKKKKRKNKKKKNTHTSFEGCRVLRTSPGCGSISSAATHLTLFL